MRRGHYALPMGDHGFYHRRGGAKRRRGTSSYNRFVKRYMRSYRGYNLDQRYLMQMIAAAWNSLTPAQKARY